MTELSELLRLERQRFNTSHPHRLIAPDIPSLHAELDRDLLDTPGHQKEEISKLMSPHVNVDMEEVLNVCLPCPQPMLQRKLLISRAGLN